jgi:hypothetical protein
MTEVYRPSPEQRRLFGALATQTRKQPSEFEEAASWFETEFSIRAIRGGEEAEAMTAIERSSRNRSAQAGSFTSAASRPPRDRNGRDGTREVECLGVPLGVVGWVAGGRGGIQ